ncbi:acetylornithine deacetylase [Shimia sp. R11_0]|uniref:acetylornithine deacetylase n=1 Tax=Shimia sp. R11_0 TaxID=2821096 RepID=UPI001ADB8F2C|nr:acetylornithine deacetylase [Shimia sp. R11_0]MBO9477272.1 acetylornithine deacetylase [Shimia sp. R11_0]
MSDLQNTLSILELLVGFATVSERSNTDLIVYVAEYLEELGVEAHVFPDATGQKHGLVAHIGPLVPGGVVLSGHTDVVPVTGQDWHSDPWTLTERGGCYYGRGTCDMKGFLALVLAAVPKMLAAPLQKPIQLALSFDEEVGCTGTVPLLAELQAQYPIADRVIVGEPTNWRVVTGHKGGIDVTTDIKGKAAHSSMPHLGVSAISAAARLAAWHEEEMRRCAEHADLTSGFMPPHSTLQVGTIHGGVAMNIVPDACVMETDIRFTPPETAEEWLQRYGCFAAEVERDMQALHPEASINLRGIEVIPAMMPEKEGPAERLARQLTGDNAGHCVSYQTEAGHFQSAGYSTVVCGPGDIAQAHQPNEFITAEQLRRGQDVMEKLIDRLC